LPSPFAQHKEKTRELFEKIAEEDGSHDRAGRLGLMELERLSAIHGIPSGMYTVDFLLIYLNVYRGFSLAGPPERLLSHVR
jgi:hypothetical protein